MSKCKCIQIGSFKHGIIVQTLTETADGFGGFTRSWADTITVAAMIKPLNGFERAQGRQLEAAASHKITIRYRTGLSTKQRISYGGRYFDIASIINLDEANKYIEIMALESVGAAI